jgi:hypothetical protein
MLCPIRPVAPERVIRYQTGYVHPYTPPQSRLSIPKETGMSERISWIDEETQSSVIEQYSRQLDSFIDTFADGRVDEAELAAQEQRLTTLMQEIEPQLDDELHAKVTKLLCELTAYDIMQLAAVMQESRPKTTFRG